MTTMQQWIGKLMRHARKRKEWSAEALAEASGYAEGTIDRLERGTTKRVDIGVVRDAFTALGVDWIDMIKVAQHKSEQKGDETNDFRTKTACIEDS